MKDSGIAGLACFSPWAPPQLQEIVVPVFNPELKRKDRVPGVQGQTGLYKEFQLGRAAQETLSVKKGGEHKRETKGTEHMYHVSTAFQ